jgi:dTDP-glucose 4,6-dehydratase
MNGEIILVTGGAGFIGSHLIDQLIGSGRTVVNLDLLTYAGNPENLAEASTSKRYHFVHGDIGDSRLVLDLLTKHRPQTVFNLAAESHVDRSIEDGTNFINTNVVAVHRLLSAVLKYWRKLDEPAKRGFRFIHMSTDEVYGSIERGEFDETSAYAPNSPYAASKAAGDHLIRSFRMTYGLPTLLTRASNTYGPRQYPEKLIPHTIASALSQRSLPVYGKGTNVRDWMFVGDLARGLMCVVDNGRAGNTLNFSGGQLLQNIDTVKLICAELDRQKPCVRPYHENIMFVDDRPGHDFRYAMSSNRVRNEFGWAPLVDFEEGLRKTIGWYLGNDRWWESVYGDGYRGMRIGLGPK